MVSHCPNFGLFAVRLVDWLSVPKGALVVPKDPMEYYKKLRFHRSVTDAGAYGLTP